MNNRNNLIWLFVWLCSCAFASHPINVGCRRHQVGAHAVGCDWGEGELHTHVQIPYWDTEMSLISLEPLPVLLSLGRDSKRSLRAAWLVDFFSLQIEHGKSLNSLETSGEKDPNTSSMCSCSCLQIETGKVKMFPRNIHTFLGQNCSSNRWFQKLKALFASVTEFWEVEGSIVSI